MPVLNILLILLGWCFWKPPLIYAEISDGIIFSQISDEHIDVNNPVFFNRLKNVLVSIKSYKPVLLISSGDHTINNDRASYQLYSLAFDQVGGFVKFPSSTVADKITYWPIAGNHDAWTRNIYDNYPKVVSYTVGNYRFVAISEDLKVNFVGEAIERELRKSCVDNKAIVVYQHYAPWGFVPDSPLWINESTWNKMNELFQAYPVIAYLAGHIHTKITKVYSPGYVAKTVGTATSAQNFGVYSLTNKRINIQDQAKLSPKTILTVIKPWQYFEGLKYTRSKAGETSIKVMAKAESGNLVELNYSIDNGPKVIMNRVSKTDYYLASFNSSALRGNHLITIRAINSKAIDSVIQNVPVYFDETTTNRKKSGCYLPPKYFSL